VIDDAPAAQVNLGHQVAVGGDDEDAIAAPVDGHPRT
jgi:hypothetical protein